MKDKLANKNLNLQTHPLLFIVSVPHQKTPVTWLSVKLVLNGLTANVLASFLLWLKPILMSAHSV